MRSLRFRLLILGGLTLVAALIVAGLGIVYMFERHVERRAEAELDTYIRQILSGIAFDATNEVAFTRALADPRFSEPHSGLYWQIEEEGKGRLIRSRSLWDTALALPSDVIEPGAVHRHYLKGPNNSTVLTHERRVIFPVGNTTVPLRIAVGLDMREIATARNEFAFDVVVALVLLGATLFGAAWAQIAIGLRPLAALQKSVLAVRTGAQKRLEVGGPKEVLPLVLAVNSLLDAQTRALDAAKARAKDLAHGLKTPLTVLLADASKVREKGAADIADEIEDLANSMRRYVDRELSSARLQGIGAAKLPLTPIEPVVSKLIYALSVTPKGERIDWQLHAEPDAAVRMSQDDLTELIGNLLDNACKWARSAISVTVKAAGPAQITIEDDGPGAPKALLHRLGERGLRLDLKVSGTGYGLAIAQDIAKAYGATLSLSNVEPHGFRADIVFPAQSGLRASAPHVAAAGADGFFATPPSGAGG